MIKEKAPSWRVAVNVYLRHLQLGNLFSAVSVLVFFILTAVIGRYFGYSWETLTLKGHRIWFFFAFIGVRLLLVNLVVTKFMLGRYYQGFRLVALEEDEA